MSSAGGGVDRPDPVLAQLRALGHPGAHWLAAGMEADVHALDENTVARLPREGHGTTPGPVDRLLEELSGRGLPFAVPATLRRFALPDGRVLQRQPWLRGRSIGDVHDPSTGYLDVRAEEALVELLSALHTLGGEQPVAAPELPLLGGRATTTAQNWSTPVQQLLVMVRKPQSSTELSRADVLRCKALYALVGTDACSADADGHFLRCAALLGRADVSPPLVRGPSGVLREPAAPGSGTR